MRAIAACVLALSVGFAAAAASQTLSPLAKNAPAALPAPNSATVNCANNPNALGLSRIVEVDTTGGPASASSISRSTISCAPRRWC